MTGKRVTSFQASKVQVIESVTVSFDLSPGPVCMCNETLAQTSSRRSPPVGLYALFLAGGARTLLSARGQSEGYAVASAIKKKKKKRISGNASRFTKAQLIENLLQIEAPAVLGYLRELRGVAPR